MKIIVTGSLGNVGRPLVQQLVAAGHAVTVISHQEERKDAITALGAQPAIGSLRDASFLTKVFTGADAVYAMTPPNAVLPGAIAQTISAGEALAAAIGASGVGRVVMLSSIGADLPGGNGPIEGLHAVEGLYRELKGVAFTFLRAGYFFTNYYNVIPMIQGMGILGSNYPAETRLPLVHPEDIATAAAEELQKPAAGNSVRYIVSDVRAAGDLAAVLGAALGKPGLPWVEFTDEQAHEGLKQAGMTEEFAGLFTDMGRGFRLGTIQADFIKEGSPVDGKIRLEEFAAVLSARQN